MIPNESHLINLHAYINEKSQPLRIGFLLVKEGQRPTLPHCIAVPSARTGLTSLFGMGRGDPRRYNHPKYGYWTKEKHCIAISSLKVSATLFPESFGQLVLLGFDVATFTPAAYQRHRL